jgi:hypothetical protein
MRIGLALAALALLGACGEEQDTGGLTAEESRELDEAANMLDTAPAVEGEETLVGEAETEAAGNTQ